MSFRGQKATFSGTGKSMTVTTYALPKVQGTYKPIKKTWYNYCPSCKTWGSLHWVQRDGSRDFTEGTLVCGNRDGGTHASGINKRGCDADFCCQSGWETSGHKLFKLRPATVTPNTVSTVASSQTKTQQCNLTKATALTKAQKKLDTVSDYKGTLKIPVITGIKAGDLCQLNVTGFDKGTYYIDNIKEDVDEQTLTLSLLKGANHLGVKYNGSFITTDKSGAIIGASSSNPLNAKCSSVNINIGLKDNSAIAKKIRLKGQQLGTVPKIYKWLRVKSGGGTGGWKYNKYLNHLVKSEAETKFGPKSAKKCWSTKKANCCDFAWIMSMMGKGAGKKVGVKKGTYKTLSGKTAGHMWNTYGTKNYDCSSANTKTIDWKKVEEVK